MRSMLTAKWIVVAMGAVTGEPVFAQMTPPATAGAKPKTVATVPVRPALQTPADTANAMAQAERLALQSDLAWVGQYNGAISGEVSERMVAAIREFQKSRGAKPTGVLNPQERGVLADSARKRQEEVGWKIVTDVGTGARLGLPTKLVPQQTSDANGAKWTSPTGTIQVVLARRKEADPTSAKLAEREKKEPPGRSIEYSVVKPDFFVLSGLQGLKKFYLRGTFRGDEVRVMTILYDQAVENTVEPVVIAMSSAFAAFPPAVASGPPPRKSVEYGTGLVVSEDGAILTDRRVIDECTTIAIAGHGHADRVAEDKNRDLALLRIYGARGLKPLDFGDGGEARNVLDLTGIADPQAQGGGNAASSVKAQVAQIGGGSDPALSPAPALGFAGAAATDAGGRFVGMVRLKPLVVAGPPGAAPATQAALVPAEAVREFLKASGVNAAGASTDAKSSVLRVICVRK